MGRSEITIVIVERRRVVWSASAQVEAEPGTTAVQRVISSAGSLLDRLPKGTWPAMRVVTALGAPWSRTKLLNGVPAVHRRRELVSMLRLNTSRFVASTRPVIITGANVISAGEVQIGIADLSMVEALTRVIADHGLRVGSIIPTAALQSSDDASGSPVDESDAVDHAAGVAIASRAANTWRSSKLGLHARDNPAAVIPDASRGRVALAAGILAAVGLAYFGSQWDIERGNVARDRAAIHGIAMASDSVAREDADLGRLSRDLVTTTSFSRRRVSTALLLGAITQALPAEAAITTLRIDTTTVDIVTLSPRTAGVVDALADVSALAAPTIIGPVSRETVGQRELERATIRLHIVPDFNRGKARFEVERDEDDTYRHDASNKRLDQ